MLTLVREGRIGLDDDACAHLPELARFKQPFPLRSLLNHTSGIPDYLQDAGRTVVFHSGCLWGFNTLILHLLDEGLSLVHLANCEAAAPDQERLLAALAA